MKTINLTDRELADLKMLLAAAQVAFEMLSKETDEGEVKERSLELSSSAIGLLYRLEDE